MAVGTEKQNACLLIEKGGNLVAGGIDHRTKIYRRGKLTQRINFAVPQVITALTASPVRTIDQVLITEVVTGQGSMLLIAFRLIDDGFKPRCI